MKLRKDEQNREENVLARPRKALTKTCVDDSFRYVLQCQASRMRVHGRRLFSDDSLFIVSRIVSVHLADRSILIDIPTIQ